MDKEKEIEEIEEDEEEEDEEPEGADLLSIGHIGEPIESGAGNLELSNNIDHIAGIDEHAADRSLVTYDPLQHYLAEVRKYRFLTKEEEHRLAVKYREEGDLDAVSRLVMANLKIAVVIAMEYKNIGMNMMDLIQEGNLGLMQAVKKFDPYRDIRLVTYATWWVRAYILRYLINNWRLVKIGTTQAQRKLFFNLMKEKARLESLGYEAGPKLIASGLGVKEKEVIEMDQRLGSREMSLDEPVKDDSDTSLMSIIPSHEPPIDEKLADEEVSALFKKKVAEFMKTMNERDLNILQNRILSEEPKSLLEIGEFYGISKERVRQLEANIIKRLKKYIEKEIKDIDDLKPT